MRTRQVIPIERVNKVLRYEPDTGKFYWKVKVSDKVVVGREAGNSTGRRDIRITLDGVMYGGHRLAWAIMTGEQPPPLIDHEDRDTRNIRWKNLREATYAENGANMLRNNKPSATGHRGIYHYPLRKKPWLARLQFEGSLRLNKYFATQDEAVAAYREAAAEWFGSFAPITNG